MDFTIDDMIEFFESEREYCEKEKIEFIKNILTTVWLKISIRFPWELRWFINGLPINTWTAC